VTIDDFDILKVIGRGAFGKVMLVEKKDTQKIYALKSLRKKDIVDRGQIEHTKTEKHVLQNVKHPFLVGLEFAFQDPYKLYFVMPFYRGGELFQHLKTKGRLSENLSRIYGCQILLGLGHLHSLNIIYRDLKPENIILDDNGNVALTDFGMAKELGEKNVTKSIVGTPEYIAPELLKRESYGKPADWWSFGTLM